MEEKSFVLNLNENAALYLYRSAQWSKFFAILGFVGSGLLVVLTMSIFLFGSFIPFGAKAFSGPHGGGMMPGILAGGFMIVAGFLYLAVAIVYLIVSLKLFRFAGQAMSALKLNDDTILESSFRNLNSFLKIMGVITIVVLSLYLIGFIVMMLAGFGAAMMGGV